MWHSFSRHLFLLSDKWGQFAKDTEEALHKKWGQTTTTVIPNRETSHWEGVGPRFLRKAYRRSFVVAHQHAADSSQQASFIFGFATKRAGGKDSARQSRERQ